MSPEEFESKIKEKHDQPDQGQEGFEKTDLETEQRINQIVDQISLGYSNFDKSIKETVDKKITNILNTGGQQALEKLQNLQNIVLYISNLYNKELLKNLDKTGSKLVNSKIKKILETVEGDFTEFFDNLEKKIEKRKSEKERLKEKYTNWENILKKIEKVEPKIAENLKKSYFKDLSKFEEKTKEEMQKFFSDLTNYLNKNYSEYETKFDAKTGIDNLYSTILTSLEREEYEQWLGSELREEKNNENDIEAHSQLTDLQKRLKKQPKDLEKREWESYKNIIKMRLKERGGSLNRKISSYYSIVKNPSFESSGLEETRKQNQNVLNYLNSIRQKNYTFYSKQRLSGVAFLAKENIDKCQEKTIQQKEGVDKERKSKIEGLSLKEGENHLYNNPAFARVLRLLYAYRFILKSSKKKFIESEEITKETAQEEQEQQIFDIAQDTHEAFEKMDQDEVEFDNSVKKVKKTAVTGTDIDATGKKINVSTQENTKIRPLDVTKSYKNQKSQEIADAMLYPGNVRFNTGSELVARGEAVLDEIKKRAKEEVKSAFSTEISKGINVSVFTRSFNSLADSDSQFKDFEKKLFYNKPGDPLA